MKIPSPPDHAGKIAGRHRVTDGKSFRLKDHAPDDTGGLAKDAGEAVKESVASGVAALAALQDRLYAESRTAVLVLFQAMDAAGKDGTIKHVMSGVNPQGCRVTSFKQPGAEELGHDFLWRCVKELPRAA